MIERKVQTYTTNESGQKIVTYQGQGLGERKLVIQKNGRTVSGTLSVLDTLLYDKATTGNKNTNWHVQTGTLETPIPTDDYGTSLHNTGTGSASYVANLPSTSPSGYDAEWEVPFCIEFDIVDCTDLSKCYLQVSANNSTAYSPALNANGSVIGSHQKIECRASGYTIYIDDRSPVVLDRPINDLASIRFSIGQGETLKYKEFKIYPI